MSAPAWSSWLPPESLALLAAATWATASLFSAAASARMGAFAFTRWRMVFAALLLGHWRLGWRGRRAVRMLNVGALLLLLGYVGSRFVMEVMLGRAP